VRSSSSKSALEADTGPWATRFNHTASVILGVGAPIYMLVPDSMSDSMLNKLFGVAISANITFHSWVGLNYVAADYVPKFSKALLPPARLAIAGMSAITFLGLSKVCLSNQGGLKAIIKGPWTARNKNKEES
jgi:succinate dehydrogenase hydrophobic anchor subunit